MFMKEFEKQINSQLTRTENGALGYKTAANAFVDFNFRISSYRNMSEGEILADFYEMLRDDAVLAMKMLFFARDVRGGLGEKRLFKVVLKEMAKQHPKTIEALVDLIPEYGRWDDLFVLFDTPVENKVIFRLGKQLRNDLDGFYKKDSISLLAKWMPSINTSSVNTVNIAYKLANAFGMTPRQYRKTLSALRGHLKVIERDLSAKEYEHINYANVPSKAHLKYKNVFLSKDNSRYISYLESLKKGETKINAATLSPYEIWYKYRELGRGFYGRALGTYDETLEQLWKNLKDEGMLESTLVVADGSGSMTMKIGATGVSALDVAQSLATYFGERCTGQFKNTFITFSNRPQLVNFGDGTLASKMAIVEKYTEVANTDIEKVFKLILSTAVTGKMRQEDLPQTILIISDMEFDSATQVRVDLPLMEAIESKFNEYGYTLPRLAFWNVTSRTLTVPMQSHKSGVILISGFNTAAIKMVMTGHLDPFEAIKDVLNSERYAPIEEALRKSA